MTKNNRNFSNTISNITTELARLEARVHGFASVKDYQSEIVRLDAERKEKALEAGLPELTGSEKQVNWALSIREKLLKKEGLADKARTKTSAKWFIDNRFAA